MLSTQRRPRVNAGPITNEHFSNKIGILVDALHDCSPSTLPRWLDMLYLAEISATRASAACMFPFVRYSPPIQQYHIA